MNSDLHLPAIYRFFDEIWAGVMYILGMIAVRENRYVVLAKDFEKAYKNQLKNKDEMEHEFYH